MARRAFTDEDRAKSPALQARSPRAAGAKSVSAATELGRALIRLPPIDLGDDAQVEARIDEWLSICEENGCRPMVASLAVALGLSYNSLRKIIDAGQTANLPCGVTRSSKVIIEKALEMLRVSWEVFITEETGNPVKWIFLGKNYFGMEDQAVHVQRTEEAALPADPAEVAARYARMLGRAPSVEIEPDSVEQIDSPPSP